MEVLEQPKVKPGLTTATYEQLANARNKIQAELKALDDQAKVLKEKREKIDTEFLRRFNAEGVTSVKTRVGTPYVIAQTSVHVADKDAFWTWMEQSNSFDFLNVSANKTLVQDHIKQHEEVPPGLNWVVQNKIGLKKS